MAIQRMPSITGEALLTSPWLSSRWVLEHQGRTVAELRRMGRIYVSAAQIEPDHRVIIEPHGTGVVRAVDAAGDEIARITRRSWLGRRWEITGIGYTYELISDPRPRRWHVAVANAPVARITGSLVSYNRVRIESWLSLPVPVVLLAWHVVARPWEATAEPRGLVPAPGMPRTSGS